MRPGGKSNGVSPFFETPNLSFEGRDRNVAEARKHVHVHEGRSRDETGPVTVGRPCVAHGSHLSSQNRKFIWIPKRDKTLIKRHRGNGTRHNATAHFAGRRAGG